MMMVMHEPGMPRCCVLRAGTQVTKGPRQTQQWGQKSDLAPSSPEMAPKRSSIASIHPSPLPIWVTSVLWLAVSSSSHPSLWPQAVFGGRSNHVSPSHCSTCSSTGGHPPLLPLPHPLDSRSSPAQGSASPPSAHQLVSVACSPTSTLAPSLWQSGKKFIFLIPQLGVADGFCLALPHLSHHGT